jgi:hypothetical protein
MRTALIILGGLLLWGVCLWAARLAGASPKPATLVFAVLWFAVAAANMWFGVARAGYGVREDAPIFLLIFTLPVAVAAIVRWKFL